MGRGKRRGAGSARIDDGATDSTTNLTDRERRILGSLVRRYEEYDGHYNLSQCKLDWLADDSETARDEIIPYVDRLIDRGLAETGGMLVRALMPQAAEALRAPPERRRLSGMAG
jgi:hypothetical protein